MEGNGGIGEGFRTHHLALCGAVHDAAGRWLVAHPAAELERAAAGVGVDHVRVVAVRARDGVLWERRRVGFVAGEGLVWVVVRRCWALGGFGGGFSRRGHGSCIRLCGIRVRG